MDKTVADVGPDAYAAIERARELFRTARQPRADVIWPHIRPHLMAAEARLARILHERPGDPEAAELLREVRRYLGGNARA